MKNLVQGNIYKTFFLFALPMILSGVLSQAMGMVNTLIAGQFLGEAGLAATGSTGALTTFCSSMFWGFSAGFGVYIARLFGAREYESIRTAVRSYLLFVGTATVFISLLCVALCNPLLGWLRVDAAVRADARIYLPIWMAAFPLHIMTNSGVVLLNALGLSGYPFCVSLTSSVLGVCGNLLTVAVLGWGVAGIALSSLLASLTATVCYLIKLRACYREMKLPPRRFSITFMPVRASLPYTLPAAGQQMTMYLANMVLAPIVNSVGRSASAAYVVVQQIYSLNASIYQNSSKTLSNYAAQCLGQDAPPDVQRGHLRRGLLVGLAQGMLLALPLLALCVIFPERTATLFLRSDDTQATSALLVTFIRFYLPFILLNLLNNLFHSLYRGVGAMRLLLISTGIGGLTRIAASLWLTPRFGMDGFYAGWAISWGAEAVFCAVVYFTGNWIPRWLREEKQKKRPVR